MLHTMQGGKGLLGREVMFKTVQCLKGSLGRDVILQYKWESCRSGETYYY